MQEIKVYKDQISNPILEVQFYLRKISKYRPEISLISLSGIYDDDTSNAVTAFQALYSLNPTGTVDLNTWNALVNEYLKYYDIEKKPDPIFYYPPESIDVKLGDNRNIVYVIQIILKKLSQLYNNYNDVNITGIFDEATSTATKQFQQYNNLPITGTVDKKTWNVLITLHDVFRFNID